MEKITIAQFMEDYDNFSDDCTVLVGFYGFKNARYTCYTRFTCTKNHLCFYEIPENGIKYYLDRDDGEEDGMIFSLKSGIKEINDEGVDYEFYDEEGQTVIWITLL